MSKRQYEHYKPDNNYEGYDHIIVGSGMASLTTAVLLAKAKKKVLVLEKHYVPGGFLHSFKRKKHLQWDVGVHYVGGMEKTSPMRTMFNYLTNHQVDWADTGDIYDQARFGEETFDFVKTIPRLREDLKKRFPAEANGIDEYFKLIVQSNKATLLHLSKKAFPPLLQKILQRWGVNDFEHFSNLTTDDVLTKIIKDPHCRAILCTQCGDYGLTPKKSSFAVHAMVVNHFFNGAYYPIGGADKIASSMVDIIVKQGGKVVVKADVDKILIDRNKVYGVQIDGNDIRCKSIISGVGVKNTYLHLLRHQEMHEQQQLNNISSSHSHICLYIGLDGTAETLNLPKHNIWYYKDSNIDDLLEKSLEKVDGDIQFLYISFPSAKDPDWNKQHRNTSTIQAISVSDMRLFDAFKKTEWLNRGEDYLQIKTTIEDNILGELYNILPQIKGRIIHTELSTPLSTQHFCHYADGEIYGIEHSAKRFGLTCLTPNTRIKGLYLTGQDITMVGVTAAMLAGIISAVHLLKWRSTFIFTDMFKNYASKP